MKPKKQIEQELDSLKDLCEAVIEVAERCNDVAKCLEEAPISGDAVVNAHNVMQGVLKSFIPLQKHVNIKIKAIELQAEELTKHKNSDTVAWFDRVMKNLNK